MRDQYDAFLELPEGMSLREAAAALGCHHRQVSRFRARAGRAQAAWTRHPQADRDRAGRLLAEGCPVTEVARTVGVCDKTILAWFPHAPRWSRADAARYGQLRRWEARHVG